jgi:hypothetical protein
VATVSARQAPAQRQVSAPLSAAATIQRTRAGDNAKKAMATSYCRADKWQEYQQEYFSPIGVLLSKLYSSLAWNFPDMRYLEEYFRKVNLLGSGRGHMRLWDLDIYITQVATRRG